MCDVSVCDVLTDKRCLVCACQNVRTTFDQQLTRPPTHAHKHTPYPHQTAEDGGGKGLNDFLDSVGLGMVSQQLKVGV
jgi:hypothetical protein